VKENQQKVEKKLEETRQKQAEAERWQKFIQEREEKLRQEEVYQAWKNKNNSGRSNKYR
jgi:hypothetical protein